MIFFKEQIPARTCTHYAICDVCIFSCLHMDHDMFDCIFLRFYISYIYLFMFVRLGPFHV